MKETPPTHKKGKLIIYHVLIHNELQNKIQTCTFLQFSHPLASDHLGISLTLNMSNLFGKIAPIPPIIFQNVNSKNKKHAFLFKVEVTKRILEASLHMKIKRTEKLCEIDKEKAIQSLEKIDSLLTKILLEAEENFRR